MGQMKLGRTPNLPFLQLATSIPAAEHDPRPEPCYLSRPWSIGTHDGKRTKDRSWRYQLRRVDEKHLLPVGGCCHRLHVEERPIHPASSWRKTIADRALSLVTAKTPSRGFPVDRARRHHAGRPWSRGACPSSLQT